MNEVFPVLSGAILGVATWTYVPARLRTAVIAVAGVLLGALATLLSGELELSLGFIPVDVAEVLLMALLGAGLAAAWQRRPVRGR